jgi:hypothetical protein
MISPGLTEALKWAHYHSQEFVRSQDRVAVGVVLFFLGFALVGVLAIR